MAANEGQRCAWYDPKEHQCVIQEDEPCVLTEAGDVLCELCGLTFLDMFPGEAQRKDALSDVHEDWRVPL